MTALRRVVARSVPIQIAGALALVALNVFAPLWYGREAFGAASAALALPYLIQGIVEPIFVSLWLRSRDGPMGSQIRARLVRDAVGVTAFAVVALVALFLTRPPTAAASSAALLAAALAAFPLLMVSTFSVALAYDQNHFQRLAIALLIHGLALVAGLLAFRFFGAAGIALAIALSHLVFQCALWPEANSAFRWLVAAAFRSALPAPNGLASRPWREYLAALAPKSGLLWLNSGVLFGASFFLSAGDVAQLKLAQAMVFASLHAVPVGAYVLQSYERDRIANAGQERRAPPIRALKNLCAAFAWGTGLGVLLWLLIPYFQYLLLGAGADTEFRSIAFAVPGIVLIWLCGAVLVARGADLALGLGAMIGIAVSLILLLLKHVEAAVLGGATLVGVWYAAAFVLKDGMIERVTGPGSHRDRQ